MARSRPNRDEEHIEGGRIGYRPARVMWVLVVGLLIALMLNATELENEAKSKPYGRNRDVWVAIWKPFAVVSHALYIDRPRAWFDRGIASRVPNRASKSRTKASVRSRKPIRSNSSTAASARGISAGTSSGATLARPAR